MSSVSRRSVLLGLAALPLSARTAHATQLTPGARTVVLPGSSRRFTEQKKPFVDAFARTATAGWGPSTGGGAWTTVNGSDANYWVDGTTGVIELTAANTSRHALLSDDDVADVDATATVSFDRAPAGAAASVALTFTVTDVNNHYRARLIVTTGEVRLALEKEVANAVTTLAATTVGSGHTRWRIRVEKAGSQLRAKAWPETADEPRPQLIATDTTFTRGRLGVRALASSGSQSLPLRVLVHRFAVESGTWATPPVVEHDRWVRLLPEPYAGMTPEIEQRLQAWATDTSPDVLAHAMNYVGEAGYGPLDTDGTRRIGADFYDYLGTSWTFDNGETKPYSGPEWEHNLDCSGFVRMVYGHQMGIPLVYDRDHDGHRLPRTSADISAKGPGVVVGQPQIGDLLFFDATEGRPGIDHVGIYLGVDTRGEQRFVSSRKTANGPTLADVGGPSTLTGTGLYARTLRVVRRF